MMNPIHAGDAGAAAGAGGGPRIMVHYPANQADSPVNLAVFQ